MTAQSSLLTGAVICSMMVKMPVGTEERVEGNKSNESRWMIVQPSFPEVEITFLTSVYYTCSLPACEGVKWSAGADFPFHHLGIFAPFFIALHLRSKHRQTDRWALQHRSSRDVEQWPSTSVCSSEKRGRASGWGCPCSQLISDQSTVR